MAENDNNSSYQKTDKGIILTLDKKENENDLKQKIRLQVINDKIIRVSATCEENFPDPKSLIIIDQNSKPEYNISEDGDTIKIITNNLVAKILKTTGEISFEDKSGNTILQEQIGGGKTFKPYTVEQIHSDGKPETYKGWTTRQVFESPDDEAFFGLGQHQADEWNYKGKNEELFQYNTKVSLPFILSSKNYGIMFDTYSFCRFGNPLPYSKLNEIFNLYDKEGTPGALTATYTAEGEENLVRREEFINYEDYQFVGKNLPKFPIEKSTVYFEGEFEPLETGEYKFNHYYSGYQKIYINDKSIYTEDVEGKGINEQEIWRTAWNPNSKKFSLNLEKGKKYKIKIIWKPDGGEAYCALSALKPVDNKIQNKLSFWSEMSKQLDYYFILGNNIDEIISGYRTLTGKAQIMPEWLLGYWQSRERYKTQKEILEALEGFRKRKLPIDNIVLDWNYWVIDTWGSYDFDPERFSNPEEMINDIHKNNAKIMISCWPKFYPKVDHFKELNEKGYIYQQSLKDEVRDWLKEPINDYKGFTYGFYDAYAPEARKIFWRQLYNKLGRIGMDSWWMDASEPNIRDCTPMDYRKLLCGPTYYGSSDEFFNAYSIVNAESIYDGQRGYETCMEKQKIDKNDVQNLEKLSKWNEYGFGNNFSPNNRRVFLLTRNGFLSQQRYSTATWSGDIGTRWEDLKAQITAGLNFSISGIPYWSQDIGGFSVEKRYEKAQKEFDEKKIENEDLKEWRELNTRWHQFGMFAPIYRSHGQFPFREPWNISPEDTDTYKIIKKCLELRYRLMPYIYSLASEVYFNDYTIMRPLVMDFGNDDKNVLNIGYQFMFGPYIMVNPVYVYKARNREVYFPKNNIWYDFYTGKIESLGGETKNVEAPYDHIPLYVRSGSIIPLGPEIEYTRQKKADNIKVFVYLGNDGKFTLYEDEGINYGYEDGKFSKIEFNYLEKTKTLIINKREGDFPGMINERTFTIVTVSESSPNGYNPDLDGKEVKYNGEKVEIKLE